MFKEGICPKCHEKIQVPEEREKIICMFCGEEILVDEALGRKKEQKKLDATEYGACLEKAKKGLAEIIHNCDNPMATFKKDKYHGLFMDFYTANSEVYEAMELLYISDQQPENCIRGLVEHICSTAQEKLEAIRFKSSRNQQQMDYNFLISVYLIPTVRKYPGSFTEPFADCLVETWNRTFKTSIGKACYDDIARGFRRKLCYITTAVCENLGKDADCYELTVLKRYRDEQLESTAEGHALVEEYYDIAPTIVKRLEKEPDRDRLYRDLYQDYLMPCIREIEAHEYEECQARYEKMVLELKEKYLH